MTDFELNKKTLDALCDQSIAVSIANSGTLCSIEKDSEEYNAILSGEAQIEYISFPVYYEGLFWFDIESCYDIETDFNSLYNSIAEKAEELDKDTLSKVWEGYVEYVEDKLSWESEEFSDAELYENEEEIIESSKNQIKYKLFDILKELLDIFKEVNK